MVTALAPGPARTIPLRRGVPFAPPLSTRLTPPADRAPGRLVASFSDAPAAAATGRVTAALRRRGYAVRWRRPGEVVLGGPAGAVARVSVRPEGAGTVVEVDVAADELPSAALALVASLAEVGLTVRSRTPVAVVLAGEDGAHRVELGRGEV